MEAELQPLQGPSVKCTCEAGDGTEEPLIWRPRNCTSCDTGSSAPNNTLTALSPVIIKKEEKKEINWCHSPSLTIAWNNLTYTVKERKKGRKIILDNISGELRAGEFAAIMGPSGAGKTTLLNILAGYKTKNVQGQILINGEDRDLRHFRKLSCYIMQDDLILPYLTVKEAVELAANLKLPSTVSKEQKKHIVQSVITSLGLTECINTRGGCLSGGQKRRLSIAQELVNNPPVIFLDEPTSGIDSASCVQCIKLLQNLARNGRTVICTIHQPNAYVFEQFDKLYMLSNGQCLYQGTTCDLVPYLSSYGFTCPLYCNPAEFLTDIATGMLGDTWKKLLDGSNPTLLKIQLDTNGRNLIEQATENETVETKTVNVGYATSSFNQFVTILSRTFLCTRRDPMVTHLRLVTHIIVGILIGFLYYDVGDDASKVFNNAGLLFFSLLLLIFTAMMPTLLTFPLEMSVFVKEHLNSWYSTKMYYLAKTSVDLPFQIVFPMIYISIVYWMTSQPCDMLRFFTVSLLSILVCLVAQSVGLLIGAIGGVEAAIFLGPVSVIPALLFSGYFITLHAIPSYLKFMSYVSYVRFAYEGTLQAIYGLNRTELKCLDNQQHCNFASPKDFLVQMEVDDAELYIDILVLGVFFISFRILGYFMLLLKLWLRN